VKKITSAVIHTVDKAVDKGPEFLDQEVKALTTQYPKRKSIVKKPVVSIIILELILSRQFRKPSQILLYQNFRYLP
jgi:hypothetical protein